jgi:transforming growth factor-beta-induced protein
MFSKKLVLRALLGSVLALTLAACGMMPAGSTERGSIAEIAAANDDLSILVTALTEAGLVDTFANDAAGPFTVFAPTNAAFAAALAALDLTAEELLGRDDLGDILGYHVAPANLSLRDVTGLEIIPTLFGMPIAQSGGVLDGSATIRASDIAASNGTIHIIDEVLLPTKTIADIAVADSRFSTLVTALSTADLVGAVADETADLTVFAPTNDAFGAALAALGLTAEELLASDDLSDILLYHVVDGAVFAEDVVALAPFNTDTLLADRQIGVDVVDGGVVLNGSVNVVITDLKAVNGVIHVIDFVLLPTPTIAEIAVEDGRFETLVAALGQAGLVDLFDDRNGGPFTVFAPTDTAFGEFLSDAGLLPGDLLASPDLEDILRYHVVDGAVFAEDVIALAPFNTDTLLADRQIGVQVVDGGVVLNGSVNVTITDIEAANGVIHVIDYVLQPTPTIAEIAVENGSFDTLVAALGAADLVELFDDRNQGPFTVFAPTDAAFTQALTDLGLTAGELLASPDLGDILSYHVVNGALSSADVLAAITAGGGTAVVETLLGEDISVALDGTDVVINGVATVTGFDIQAANGVIHVIDYVLLPPSP